MQHGATGEAARTEQGGDADSGLDVSKQVIPTFKFFLVGKIFIYRLLGFCRLSHITNETSFADTNLLYLFSQNT